MTRFLLLTCVGVWGWAGGFFPLIVFSCEVESPAEPPADTAASGQLESTNNATLIHQIGIGGVWKLGHPCPITVRIPAGLIRTADSHETVRPSAIEVTTLDGDAVEVAYRRRLEPNELVQSDGNSNYDFIVPVRIGRSQSLLSVSLLDDQGRELIRQDQALPADSGLPPTQPLILTIGSTLGAEDLVRTSVDGLVSSVTVLNILQATDLPGSYLDYFPVDVLVISTSNISLLSSLNAGQWSAMDEFIRSGGACIISLGTEVERLRQFPQLLEWIPGELLGDGVVRTPAALESLVTTDQPVQPFPTVVWRADRGNTRLNLTDSLGKQTSWWVSTSHGFGSIQVIASDLAHPSFAQWKNRRQLWERLVAPYFDKSDLELVKTTGGSGNDSYLGYNDLAGQLRATLEQFSGVTVVTFAQIAAALIGILILIGPVDYFLSVRWLKRPHLSWPVAGGFLLAASLALVWIYHGLRPDKIMVNSAAIVDIDARTGRVLGHQWSHIYSALARRVNVDGSSSFTGRPVHVDWQGLPGSGLGGLQSTMRIERGMPAYRVELAMNGGSSIESMGIPAAGTKSLYSVWTENLPWGVASDSAGLEPDRSSMALPMQDSELREMSTVDQLEGEVINPLNVDLRDAALFYHRWYYALKSRMPPGDRILLSTQMVPRDISRRMNRQQEIDGKVSAARWDPAERGQLDRLLELMMFHKAATGRNYTSLNHRYQPIIDHSNLLETNCAILIGRLDAPACELSVVPCDPGDQSLQTQEFSEASVNRTWVRILLPVTTKNSPTRNR